MNMDLVKFSAAENPLKETEGDLTALCDFLCEKDKIVEALKARLEPLSGVVLKFGTEKDRKASKALIGSHKKVCTSFEKNLKLVKKVISDVPKKLDETSRATRAIYEPLFEQLEKPFAELKAQEELVQKWWKKEGIPFDKYGLENLLVQTVNAEPSEYSTPEEKADFEKHQKEYMQAIDQAITKIKLAEQAEQEQREAQAKEAERLRLQKAEQDRIAAEQARKEAEQRKAQEAIEAEQRRIAAEAAKLEQEKQQAATPPPISSTPLTESQQKKIREQEKAMRRVALSAITDIVSAVNKWSVADISLAIARAIHVGKIPYVRFDYTEVSNETNP